MVYKQKKFIKVDQEESEIVFDEQVKQNVKKVFLKVKKLVKCDQCPRTFYEQTDLETHTNSHKKTQDTQVPKANVHRM